MCSLGVPAGCVGAVLALSLGLAACAARLPFTSLARRGGWANSLRYAPFKHAQPTAPRLTRLVRRTLRAGTTPTHPAGTHSDGVPGVFRLVSGNGGVPWAIRCGSGAVGLARSDAGIGVIGAGVMEAAVAVRVDCAGVWRAWVVERCATGE